MTTPTITETRRNGAPIVGERTELGRYVTAVGEVRILYGQRIGSKVRVTDVPRGPGGRAFLVERGLEEDGYAALLALAGEYLRHAEELGMPPMATSAMSPRPDWEETSGGDDR